MRVIVPLTTLLAVLPIVLAEHALFIKRDAFDNGKRVTRQTNADQMVQNILQWLQGVYTQNSRRIRQGSFREYLPPSNTQKPRPFEPPGSSSEDNFIGYPPSGSITPHPPFNIPTNSPPTSGEGYPTISPEITPPDQPGYTTGRPSRPTTGYPGYPSGGYPTSPAGTEQPITGSTGGYPSPTTPGGYPSGGPSTGYPSGGPSTGYPSGGPSTGYPSGGPSTSYPSGGPSTVYPPSGSPSTGYPSGGPSTGYPSGGPTPTPGFPTQPPTEYPGGPSTQPPVTGYPTQPSQTGSPSTGYPNGPQPIPTRPPPGYSTTSEPGYTTRPTTDDNNIVPTQVPDGSETDEDLKHPPHIHAINVDCAKDMMTINIEFNRQFDGVIYSKGFYNNPDCRYVKENSGQTKYSFTVSLNSCGTEFINGFDTEGKSYLENVLVLQNEPGIQEVWDTIRSVRCLWEGSLNKALSVALSVGMLSQEIVTFSGDTAMARLDIQLGRGPFAPPANGLVKIGDIMTLVVSVSGDPGFDIQVRDCRAKDSTGEHVVALTDENGCVLKPKLFGAFQKTRNTQNTGASIIAYAFFNAFKFPDVMDLMLECNVELCKTDCEMCPDPNQKIEPGRRRKRRDVSSLNSTADLAGDDSVTMGKMLRVVLPEDLSDLKFVNVEQNDGVCMSTQGFVFTSALLISLLTCSCFTSAYLWLKNQRLALKQNH